METTPRKSKWKSNRRGHRTSCCGRWCCSHCGSSPVGVSDAYLFFTFWIWCEFKKGAGKREKRHSNGWGKNLNCPRGDVQRKGRSVGIAQTFWISVCTWILLLWWHSFLYQVCLHGLLKKKTNQLFVSLSLFRGTLTRRCLTCMVIAKNCRSICLLWDILRCTVCC